MIYQIILSALLPIMIGCGGTAGKPVVQDPNSGGGTVGAVRRSVKLNSYNAWHLVIGQDLYDPKKLEGALQLLSRYDKILLEEQDYYNDTPGWDKLSVASLKKLNPNTKLYRYFRCAKATFEDDWGVPQSKFKSTMRLGCPIPWWEIEKNNWWLRDGAGNKVVVEDHYYLLDLGKPGLKERYLECALSRLKSQGLTGVCLDYLRYALTDGWSMGGWFENHPLPTNYQTDMAYFDKAVKPFMTYVSDGIRGAGYKYMYGCLDLSTASDSRKAFMRSRTDIMVYEMWSVTTNCAWRTGSEIAQSIDDLNKDPLECWVADTWLTGPDPEIDRKQMVSLAMYYVAIPMTQDNRSYHTAAVSVPSWQAVWDFYIGTPSSAQATKLSDKYFWSRKYSQGIVLLNYESTDSVTFNLNGKYHDVNGKTYSGQISVPAHTGLILAVGAGQS